MQWVAITSLALTFLVFLGAVALVMATQLWAHESVAEVTKAHERAQREMLSAHKEEVSKLIDGPRQPEVMLPPEQASKRVDEDWILSPESLIEQGDDLSPVFDADEV